MSSVRYTIIISLVLLIVTAATEPANAQADLNANQPVGVVDTLLGNARFIRPNLAPVDVTLNAETLRSDTLETGASSLLEVQLIDGSRLKLGENASLTIAHYATGGTPESLFQLARGRLRSTVSKTFRAQQDSFQVSTSEGLMGVQGTIFDIIAYLGITELFVYSGVVSVSHIDPQFPEKKLVKAGESLRFNAKEPLPEPEKFCDDCAPDAEPVMVPPADSSAPIVVGPRKEVGKESAGKKVAGGILGGLLGGGSKKSSGKGPKTKRDPSRKMDFVSLKDKSLKGELEMRSLWTEDGLLVSTQIEDFPDKGTFQTVFLEDCSGARLGPSKVEIYKIWSEAKLTVSWTKTTFVNGRQVGQESGGWTDSWILDSGIFTRKRADGSPEMPAIWKQMGFARGHAGLRRIGAYFNLTPDQLAEKGRVVAFAHITQPKQDPVTTASFTALISPDSDKTATITSTTGGANSDQWQDWNTQCVEPRPMVAMLTPQPAQTDTGDDNADEPDQDLPSCEDMLNAPWPAELAQQNQNRPNPGTPPPPPPPPGPNRPPPGPDGKPPPRGPGPGPGP